MRHRIKHFLGYFKKKRVYIPATIVAIIAFVVFGTGNGSGKEEKITVAPATFVQEVLVTGKVVAAQNVEMGFESSGRVARVNVKVGEQVSEGQVVASLSNGDEASTIQQRQAQVDAEAAKLAELRRGARAEDLIIAEADVTSAQTSYEQKLQALIDEIKDAYAKSDDAVRSRVDQLYTNPRSANPEIISFDNYPLRLSLNDQRLRAGESLAKWNASLSKLTVSAYSESALTEARTYLSQMRTFTNDLTSAVSGLQESAALTQTTIDKYRSDVSSARNTVSTAISSLGTAEQAYRSALNELDKSKKELSLKRAGSTQEQIAAQEAQLKSAQASLGSARATIGKTLVVAPFAGILTKADIKVGEIASPNTPVFGIISSAAYELESHVSESDVAKVSVGQPAKVTLDAYGKEVVFDAKVVQVDPAETILDGISTYKTKLQFVTDDQRIRSGMTANITIQTAEKPATVIVPQEALFLEGGEKVVTVEVGGKKINKPVVTGGINTAGEIEILSGLEIGDQIIIKKK